MAKKDKYDLQIERYATAEERLAYIQGRLDELQDTKRDMKKYNKNVMKIVRGK